MPEQDQPELPEVAEGEVVVGDDGSVTIGAPVAKAGARVHSPVPAFLADDEEGESS
jgi:hypothetical protein